MPAASRLVYSWGSRLVGRDALLGLALHKRPCPTHQDTLKLQQRLTSLALIARAEPAGALIVSHACTAPWPNKQPPGGGRDSGGLLLLPLLLLLRLRLRASGRPRSRPACVLRSASAAGAILAGGEEAARARGPSRRWRRRRPRHRHLRCRHLRYLPPSTTMMLLTARPGDAAQERCGAAGRRGDGFTKTHADS
eukprot:scaffold655_cov379-Prasinococcus_capsulatus_cf.AAC.12